MQTQLQCSNRCKVEQRSRMMLPGGLKMLTLLLLLLMLLMLLMTLLLMMLLLMLVAPPAMPDSRFRHQCKPPAPRAILLHNHNVCFTVHSSSVAETDMPASKDQRRDMHCMAENQLAALQSTLQRLHKPTQSHHCTNSGNTMNPHEFRIAAVSLVHTVCYI